MVGLDECEVLIRLAARMCEVFFMKSKLDYAGLPEEYGPLNHYTLRSW